MHRNTSLMLVSALASLMTKCYHVDANMQKRILANTIFLSCTNHGQRTNTSFVVMVLGERLSDHYNKCLFMLAFKEKHFAVYPKDNNKYVMH